MSKSKKIVDLTVDRITGNLPNATTLVAQHDIDIPEGYIAEVWGAEFECSGLLDTGGVIEYFLSLDDDVNTYAEARASDDVIFSGGKDTLLVTTGGGEAETGERSFFPHGIVTAKDIIQWIFYTDTNWSVAYYSVAIFYRLRKATPADITSLLLRRR